MSNHLNSAYYKESFHKSIANLPKTVIPAPKAKMRLRMGSLRLTDLVKIGLGMVFGFTLRVIRESSEPKLVCKPCSQCPTDPELEFIQADHHQQLREPFKPRNRFEVLRYEYFNSSVILDNFDDGPKRGILGHHKSDIKDIIAQAMTLFNTAKPQVWTMKKLLNGYRRLDPIRGEEYFLDLELTSKMGHYTDKKPDTLTEVHRFQMVKPFGVAKMISEQLVTGNKLVHFILPITYDIDSRLDTFLSTYEEECLKTKEHVYLLVILFTGQGDAAQKKMEIVRSKIHDLGVRYAGSHIRIIQTGKPFNRALGLDLGAKQLPPETLIFFTDTDVIWTREFLTRCRYNAVISQQVYYPIVFAQYNPDMVTKYSPQEEIKNGLIDINKHTGHWVYYGFGMVCMYNQDYRSVGGFNLNRKGWGGEDVELHDKHVNSNLNVFRATEPGLIHLYHNKSCDPRLTADQMRMCVGSMANGYASKSQLGINLLMPKVKLQAAPARLTTKHRLL